MVRQKSISIISNSANMSRNIKFDTTWENQYEWIKPSKMSEYYALCIFCKQYFSICEYGKAQIVRHHKSQKHNQIEKTRTKNKSTLILTPINKSNIAPTIKFGKEEDLVNAELIWTLRIIDGASTFNNTKDSSSIFKLMFPDSIVANNMNLCNTKLKYLTQFGIVPYIEKLIKADTSGSPFSMLLHETSIFSAKKQVDLHLQYWSNNRDEFIPALYCGSIFLTNSKLEQLKIKFFELLKKLNLDPSLLLQINLSNSSVSPKFSKMLSKELEENYFTSLLENIGNCTLYPVCLSLKKGLNFLNLYYEEFLHDLIYFVKSSDFVNNCDKNLLALGDVVIKFFGDQASSRWLFLKVALSKILEQYKSIKDYFLIWLPKQENFKREIESSSKYKSVVRTLKDRRTLIYIHFIINVCCIFEPLLVSFLRREPFFHSIYESFTHLLFDLMSNFLKRSVLVKAGKKLDGDKLIEIDCRNTNLHLQNVVLNLNTKKEIGVSCLGSKVIADMQKEFLQFYVESASYLQTKLPLNSTFLKDIRHLHPLKRNADAIARICKTIITVIRNENVLNRLFHTQAKDKNYLCDIVSHQAKLYVLEKELPPTTLEEHWKQLGKIKNSCGEPKYLQLCSLVKCVMVLNHGNSAPERGLAIAQQILEKNKNHLDEDSFYCIRLVKDFFNCIGGVEHFVVNGELIKAVKNLQKKYVDLMDKKRKRKQLRV